LTWDHPDAASIAGSALCRATTPVASIARTAACAPGAKARAHGSGGDALALVVLDFALRVGQELR